MSPQTSSTSRKSEAQSRNSEEARREASKTGASLIAAGPRVFLRPEDDKYFDPPCTD